MIESGEVRVVCAPTLMVSRYVYSYIAQICEYASYVLICSQASLEAIIFFDSHIDKVRQYRVTTALKKHADLDYSRHYYFQALDLPEDDISLLDTS